ncbi:putative pentatricopeptide repeat-containing protein At5g52630 [Phoenix dactylifera]|uniref:Pentatricopeptide repeat-containing protein At5g52630 n=1 Tax=Phoenix dactylifera TaxID=42345 RepID=A0A8B7BS26_PHODC|nr:putative pentatricopeptide repeat-containing protein At5g52630 [Phoenix dactylifera]
MKLVKSQPWRPPDTVLAQLIQSSARNRNPGRGKQLHAHLVASGATPSTFVANHLISMYAKCGDLDHAIALFDRMPQRNLVTWTAMISGFSQNNKFADALRTFSSMCAAGIKPTQFALSSAIQASASFGSLEFGRQMHSLSVKLGFDVELFVGSNLAGMYSKCGSLVDACRVFDEMPDKDEVAWTAMIDGHAKNGSFEEAIVALRDMFREGTAVIDPHVLCSVLSACGGLKAGKLGQCLHSCAAKLGSESDTFVGNALVNMYAKAGDMESASNAVGANSSGWNVVSCSSLIDGYVEMDRIEEASKAYVESRRQGLEPNEFTFSSMIKACASQAALEQGIQLHAQVTKSNFVGDPFVSSTLVDMYGKCGLLNSSVQVFDEIQHPSDVAWNSIVGVFAQHGRGKEAIGAFNRMISRGNKPNHVTFVSLLMACSHAGLVDEGLEYFHSMNKGHGLEPREEHYACVIDMLGRAGRLEEAREFIARMPFEPNAYGWCSLLGACRTHGDKELGERAAEKLMKLEPENSGIHILLSSIYASMGRWEDVKAVRKLMRDSRVKKLPGFSWVDVSNKTHMFGAEDWSHPQKKEIYEKLEELMAKIREAGYVPFTGSMPWNLEETLKERLLHHHSERIAVAFALISMPATKPIIVKKNLRVCVDCHSAIKLISKVEEREIIVRDHARFHHFADGLCSCGDYW